MLHSSRNHETAAPDEPNRRFPGPHIRPARPASPLKFFASSSPAKAIDRRESQKAWTANYLADLRSNRPARPSGSRPLVHRDTYPTALPVSGPVLRPSSALALSRPSCSIQKNDQERPSAPDRCSSAMSHRQACSEMLASDEDSPLARHPHTGVASRDFSNITVSTTASMTPLPGTYVERAQRRVEKEEARLLREALEEVDSRSEARLHAAAQEEASDLVWKHRNPEKLQTHCGDSYKSDQIVEQEPSTDNQPSGYIPLNLTKEHPDRSTSERFLSNKRDSSGLQGSRGTSLSWAEGVKPSSGEMPRANTQGHDLWDSPQKKAYTSLNFPVSQSKAVGHRRVSGPKSRKLSGGLFRNPDDKIYEEPDVVKDESHRASACEDFMPPPLKLRARNSVARFQSASYGFLRSKSAAEGDEKVISRTEIHRNPPSQSRNPTYMQNTSTPDSAEKQDSSSNGLHAESTKTKNGIEIRGEDIRAATSMRMKDRSTKLPSPTVVSAKPGRPIVSFDRDWKPKDPQVEQHRPASRDGARTLPSIPSISVLPESTHSAPAIPTLNLPSLPSIQIHDSTTTSVDVSSASSSSLSAIPSISVNEPEIPSISFSDVSELTSVKNDSSRPLPFKRPLPYHSSTTPARTSIPHWSPSTHSRPTAQCAACALPIAGRIVSAASQRFHPHCFTCFHCGELLECVAFYPEPTTNRENRLTRIETRASDPDAPDDIDGRTAADDGDSSLRFYCHLDFHELFSPRCRSCKTPIEGEVVLACGGEWHKGHFFCAQCGDPFDEKTPFVEKDGYAWCVGCHAGRFNGKCKGCKKVILEQGVQALGGEWHEGCFCCVECGGGFDDGRFFTRGDDEKPVCVRCEERRLKA